MVSMKLAAVHSPTAAPNHSNGPGAGRQHFVDRPAQRLRDIGRESDEHGRHRISAVLGAPEQMGGRGGEDEEREQRHQSEIGEIAGVDEAVVIDSDRDPLDHFPRGRLRLELFLDAVPNAARMLASRLRRASGDWGETSLM